MQEILERRELRIANLTKFVRDVTNDIHQTSQYIGPSILPLETVNGPDWEIVKKKAGIPVMANIHAEGAETGVGERWGTLKVAEGTIPGVRRKLPIDPKTYLRLKQSQYQSDLWKQLIEEMYDDVATLTDAVLARVEWFRWQALAKGSFTYSEDGIIQSVDFQATAANIVTVGTDSDYGQITWDNVTGVGACDWLSDLRTYCRWYQRTYGVRLTRAICSSTVMDYMLANTEVGETYLWGSDYGARLMAVTELNNLLSRYQLPTFVEYDVKVRSKDAETGAITEERLLPEYRIVLLPDASVRVGSTISAPTVEALMNSEQLQGQPAPGLYAEAWIEGQDVKTLWTKVSAKSFPLMDGMDKVGVLIVNTES